ncbi:hypothetical protein [Methylobacterium sp. J-077]|uniref:hypothetical protein n=1 Tax=Methylobacterium sp. J-077 TaxID=2836656 RepID=UPI001FB9BFCA|nr:hypothetical protein [Methylobacterium sp. J-077]MCJ2124469.1 hypothetical protein [Methylobacterium sp. J-077]
MSDVVAALLLALAAENAGLREQLASAQDMLVETAIDAGNLHALVDALRTERDAWREEAERRARWSPRTAQPLNHQLRGLPHEYNFSAIVC